MAPRSPSRPLPGRQKLSREFIAAHQRARIAAALTEEIAARGYRAVTVADIVRRAGIARNTFYENFTSKEDCFLAVQDLAAKEALRRMLEGDQAGASWEERVTAALGTFLGYVAEEPALARACLVEALTAGDAARSRYEESVQSFVPLLRSGRDQMPDATQLPDALEEMVVGGIFWILYRHLVLGETEQIESLLPELVDFALTPYMGAVPARRAVARL